jgi:hypothetical protein
VKPEGIPLRLLDAWSCAGADRWSGYVAFS